MNIEVRGTYRRMWPGFSSLFYVTIIGLIGLAFAGLDHLSTRGSHWVDNIAQPVVLARTAQPDLTPKYSLQKYLPDVAITSPEPGIGAPIISRIPTTQPVVFLGIDDGWVHHPEAAAWFARHKLPVTLFLTDEAIRSNYGYFKNMRGSGVNIQNHTLSHHNMKTLSRDLQKFEICATADIFASAFGVRPTLFRPPYGLYNDETRQVAAECGMKAIVMWRAYIDDGVIHYQDEDNQFHPGDIVLMHFRSNFTQDMNAFMAEANQRGLTVANLADWLR